MNGAALARPQRAGNLWRSVGKLLRLRWIILVSGYRRASLRGKAGAILLGLLALTALGFAFTLSWLALEFLRSPQLAQYSGDAQALLASVPAIVASAAFTGILVTSFSLLLQVLYLAGDMEFLLSAPVPIRAVFVSKIVQAILPNFGLILLMGLPVLYGLGASGGYTVLYYPAVLLILVFLALAAAGISSLLVMAVVRIFPARRVAELLGLLVAVVSITCSQSGQLFRFGEVSQGQVSEVLDALAWFNSPWSPLSWAGRSMIDIGDGRWLSGTALFLLTIGLSGGIFGLSLNASERLYISGWARVQVSLRAKKAPRPLRPAGTHAVPGRFMQRIIPPAVGAMVRKDLQMLRRDLRNMSQMVTPLVVGIIYAVMLLRSGGEPPAGRGEAPPIFMEIMKNLLVYGNVGIALFVSWAFLSRLAIMGFSQERKSFWVLKTAPVSAAKMLAAKFLVAYLPTLVLGWGFLVVIHLLQGASASLLATSLVAVAMTIAGLAGLNLAFGVLGANFDWEDPRRISPTGTGCLGALVSIAFQAVSLALFFGPPLLMRMLARSSLAGQVLGVALGSAFCLACALLPPWLVHRRVERLDEK